MTDSNEFDPNASIIGLVLGKDGKPVGSNTIHRDGSEEQENWPTDSTKSDDRPATWHEPRTSPLTEKKRAGLTRKEHIDRSLRLEAKVVSLDSTSTDKQWSEGAAARAFCELVEELGGKWVIRAEAIRKQLGL
jgi:hypothetical protein